MEKEWVFLHRCSVEYEAGLQAFIAYAVEVAAIDGDIKCPCKECGNRHRLSPTIVEGHLQMSQSHSTWPVVMSVYNLPPWLCMKKPYLMLSLLIPGPTSPGNNIDVYLRPLIDELKSLWDEGVPTYDAFKKETFKMRAAVMWTINDFPAYGMLSGWSTKGYKACPHCGHNTRSIWLPNSQKCSYLGHRRWLPILHRFRRWTVAFDGHQEHMLPPIPMTGAECLAELSTLRFQFGKKKKSSTRKKRSNRQGAAKETPYVGPWKKQTVFFELPYWKDLLLRHNLDVMHIEKNVTDSVLGTLLATDGKNKDTYNARLDCVHLGIKKRLQPKNSGDRPPAGAFNLKNDEKTLMCEVFASSKLPDGLASNISRSVRVEEKKLVGLKSHDSHIIMQYLLPLAIRHALPKFVAQIFIELSSFFRNLCTKVGTVGGFHLLSRRIAIVLCMLEHLMPPAFFDIMVHLPIHLADEAAIAGPVHFRWMFPIERGYGIGVEWADVPGILTEKEMVANDVGALRSQVEDSREEIARLREESAKKDEEMIVIKTKLTEIEARLQTPLDGLLSSGVDNIQKLIAALTQAAEKHSQPSDQEMHSNAVPFGGSVSLITH